MGHSLVQKGTFHSKCRHATCSVGQNVGYESTQNERLGDENWTADQIRQEVGRGATQINNISHVFIQYTLCICIVHTYFVTLTSFLIKKPWLVTCCCGLSWSHQLHAMWQFTLWTLHYYQFVAWKIRWWSELVQIIHHDIANIHNEG